MHRDHHVRPAAWWKLTLARRKQALHDLWMDKEGGSSPIRRPSAARGVHTIRVSYLSSDRRRLVKLGGLPIDPVGRLVSFAFLIGCAWPALRAARSLRVPRGGPWVFCALKWTSPLYGVEENVECRNHGALYSRGHSVWTGDAQVRATPSARHCWLQPSELSQYINIYIYIALRENHLGGAGLAIVGSSSRRTTFGGCGRFAYQPVAPAVGRSPLACRPSPVSRGLCSPTS